MYKRQGNKLTVSDFYNREAEAYDAKRWTGPIGEYVSRTQERLVLKALDPRPGMTVLEIGCGTGRFTVAVARSGAKITGVDIAEDMLRATERKLASEGLGGGVELLQLDAKALPFADRSYDAVLTCNVLNHVPGYAEVLKEAARVLKPGGVFVLGYPSLYSVYVPYAALVNARRKSLRRGVYTRWLSTPRVVQECRGLGLELVESFGQFHCPPLGLGAFSGVVAVCLRVAGSLCETGPLRRLAPTRIVVFRKRADEK